MSSPTREINIKKNTRPLVEYFSYKDSDNSDYSNSIYNDKDNISDNDNSSNIKVT